MSDEYEVISTARFEGYAQLMVLCPNPECHWIEFIDPAERGHKHRCDRCKNLYLVPLKREEMRENGTSDETASTAESEATPETGGQGGDS